MRRQLVGLVLAFVASVSLADSSAQTTPQTFVSSFGRYRLTVFPLEDPEAAIGTHFQYMVKLPSSLRETSAACEATLERWVGNSYELVWRKPLVNKISPVSAIVSARDGSFVTFDDWSGPGYGENVVVIYSGNGELIKKFALRDLMTEKQIDDLPGTIGSIAWGGHHILVEGGETLLLRIAAERDRGEQKYRDLEVRMSDGTIAR